MPGVASLPSLRDTTPVSGSLRQVGYDPCRPGELSRPLLQRGNECGDDRTLPSSWATPMFRLHMLFDSGETVCSRPSFRTTAWPLLRERQRLSQVGLSKLNHMAFGLAAGTERSLVGFVTLVTSRNARFASGRCGHRAQQGRRYRTGFPPAGSQSKVSNSHHANLPPPPSFLAQALFAPP